MVGRIVVIDEERCDGCGLCVSACHEGALALVGGKARLVREDYCDGMGDCLPACPRDAISFVDRPDAGAPVPVFQASGGGPLPPTGAQWPIQLGLVPPRSPVFEGRVVFAADCTAFVLDGFRSEVLRGDPVVVSCPKLDDRTRFGKVEAIMRENPVDEAAVVRMEVPCCSALAGIVRSAAEACGRDVRVTETVVSRDGRVLRGPRPAPRSAPVRTRAARAGPARCLPRLRRHRTLFVNHI